MQAKNNRSSSKINKTHKKTGKSASFSQVEGRASQDSQEKMDRSAELFVSDLIIRGEAAKPKDGKLPPGATHEIVKENKEGLPTVRRRRYSAF